jgi:drug/metabolite transporter (DMT)-like permease
MQDTASNRVTIVAFLACGGLAGGNAVCIRLSNRELAPMWSSGTRFLAAAAVLWLIALRLGRPVPRGNALAGAVLYGSLNFAAAFALAYYGLQRAPAGLSTLLLALVPIATLFAAALHRQERLTLARIVGGLVAVVGVTIAASGPIAEDVPVLSVLALAGSVVCFAEATVVARHFTSSDPVVTNAIGMTVASVFLLALAFVLGESKDVPGKTATWVALGYLVVAGSVAVFWLYLFVVRSWEASRAAYVDVIIPIVTPVAAYLVLDEPIGIELVLGGALVLAGVYLGALRTQAAPQEAPAAP